MSDDTSLHLDFDTPGLPDRLRWRCEAPRWRVDTERRRLLLETAGSTDFWQRTHYGFEVDNGHFLGLKASGDFVLTARISVQPKHQYDQAGLMLRISPTCWLKTSIEHEPDEPDRLGAVVTNSGYSDWSTRPLKEPLESMWFRLRAEAEDCIVDASFDGDEWHQIRMAHLLERSAVTQVECGLYACSPKAAGFEAAFHFLHFEPGRLK